jgi:hypothetical protein
VVLAAVPRSASTLVCHLLNRLPDTVALHEPFSLSGLGGWRLGAPDPERALRGIDGFFASARASLRERGEACSKQVAGEVPDNPIGPAGRGTGSMRRLARRVARRLGDGGRLRRGQVVRGTLRVSKPLSDDFFLCVKHPSVFAGLLHRLVERYPCFATVRNPVAVLGSWNSVEFSVSEGRSRGAERLDPALGRELSRCRDRSERQLRLLDWYFERIARSLPPERVIRYEDVVATGGAVLGRIAGARVAALRALQSRNRSKEYDAALVLALGERLLAAPGAWSAFYAPDALERLLGEIEAGALAQATPGASSPTCAPPGAGAGRSPGGSP